MGSTQAYHDPAYLIEVWILYGFGMLLFALRLFVRLRTIGFRNFQGDDWFTFLVIAFYTVDAVVVERMYRLGTNVDFTPAQLAQYNEQEISQIVLGSKYELVAWYNYTGLIWALKACMLFFFNRLTFGLDVHVFVKVLAYACGATYLAVLVTITAGCRPYHVNWAVSPYPPEQCTLRSQNFTVTTVLNVVTDAAMLCIPLPILWKLNVTLKKKLTLAVLLSSGVFIIAAAIIRIVMTLKAHPSALTINVWGVRETVVGIFAVNIPILRPLFSKSFWSGDFPSPNSSVPRQRKSLPGKMGTGLGKLHPSVSQTPGSYEMRDDGRQSSSNIINRRFDHTTTIQPHDSGDTASEECIIPKTDRLSESGNDIDTDVESGPAPEDGGRSRRLEVMMHTTYEVQPTSVSPGEDSRTHSVTSPEPGQSLGHYNGQFWDRRWQERGFGNRTTVGSVSHHR